MSLYANISVSNQQKSQQEEIAVEETTTPSKRQAKSAALYAGVLAKPAPSPAQVVTEVKVTKVVIPQPSLQTEPDKPSEIAGNTSRKNSLPNSAALQFKPALKRLQKTVKTKSISLAPPQESSETPVVPFSTSARKSYLQDVSKIQEDIANDDVNGFYRTLEGQKLARKAAKKKKRKNNDGQGTYVWTWDDDYDPLHPNEYEAYIDSDEHLREQIEWQNKLEGRDEVEAMEELDDTTYRGFAPPPEDDEDDWVPPEDDGHEFVPEPVAEIPLDETPDEIYARRMKLALEAGMKIRPPTPPSAVDTPQNEEEQGDDEQMNENSKEDTQEPSEPIPNFYDDEEPPPQSIPAQPLFNFNQYNQPPSLYSTAPGMQPSQPRQPPPSATISSEPVHYATTISSEPTHYVVHTPTTDAEPPANQPRSLLPGQKGFAARLMSKYGWEKGQALGTSTQTGLVTPLVMKVDKEKKGTGVIVDRNRKVEDYGRFGKMSRCIVLCNVVAPGDVDDELVDEIGEECRSKVFRLWMPLM